MAPTLTAEQALRQWRTDDPDRVIGRGHPIGDRLDAWDWRVLERESGRLRVRARLPDHLKNPRGQLFGGYTGTYVDFFALHVTHTTWDDSDGIRWQQTANLRIDYFAPIEGPEFEMQGEILNQSARTNFVEVRFLCGDSLAAVAQVTLIAER